MKNVFKYSILWFLIFFLYVVLASNFKVYNYIIAGIFILIGVVISGKSLTNTIFNFDKSKKVSQIIILIVDSIFVIEYIRSIVEIIMHIINK